MNRNTEREELIRALLRLLAEATEEDIKTIYIFARELTTPQSPTVTAPLARGAK